MTQPLHLCDQAWRDTETLVHRLESLARTLGAPTAFYEELVGGLRFACGAVTTTLLVLHPGRETLLARSGMKLHQDSIDSNQVGQSQENSSEQQRFHVAASLAVHDHVQLQLDIQFDQTVALSTEEHLSDLLDVLLSLAASVYLRQQFDQLLEEQEAQSDRDQLLSGLNEGTSLGQSFTAIASTLARRTSADRVSLLRVTRRRSELIATSTQPNVDRRTTMARSLETISSETRNLDSVFWPSDHSTLDTETDQTLEFHQQQSQCRSIWLRNIFDSDHQPIATLIFEWLRPETDIASAEQDRFWQSVGEPTEQAVRRAIARDQVGNRGLIQRLTHQPKKIVGGIILVSLCLILLAAVPTTLHIPAEGTVVASKQSRLFAPVDAVVSEVLVENDQPVDAGQPLLRLTSAGLEQSRTEIEGKLATRRAQAAANLASRTSPKRSPPQAARASSVTADDRILKTEIDGLEAQLELIERREKELLIVSPIPGQVDSWNLKQSLLGRPVARGQHLLDIIASDEAYHVELQLPDRLSGYIDPSSKTVDRHVAFRLRSDPTVTYHGTIRNVAATAHRDAVGGSFINCKVDLSDEPTERLRHGATVIAHIDGPKRSLGFVWFRHIIQWSRENIWL